MYMQYHTMEGYMSPNSQAKYWNEESIEKEHIEHMHSHRHI